MIRVILSLKFYRRLKIVSDYSSHHGELDVTILVMYNCYEENNPRR
jgi:hypothetical protein